MWPEIGHQNTNQLGKPAFLPEIAITEGTSGVPSQQRAILENMLLTADQNCSYASCTGLLWGNLEQHVPVLRASVLCRLPDCKLRISAPGLESSEELNDSQSAKSNTHEHE